jgi:hypothetical protein
MATGLIHACLMHRHIHYPTRRSGIKQNSRGARSPTRLAKRKFFHQKNYGVFHNAKNPIQAIQISNKNLYAIQQVDNCT